MLLLIHLNGYDQKEGPMKNIVWLIIANSVAAKIYEITETHPTLINELNHPKSRAKSQELGSDRPGRYKTSHAAHGEFTPPHDLHVEEHQHFAKELADLLNEQRKKNCYNKIILCAEPHFLGLINQALTKEVTVLITKVIEKDYITLPASQLNAVIQEIAHPHLK